MTKKNDPALDEAQAPEIAAPEAAEVPPEGHSEGNDPEAAAEVEAAPVETVAMHRVDATDDGPTTADVHPDEVQNFIDAGWRVTE